MTLSKPMERALAMLYQGRSIASPAASGSTTFTTGTPAIAASLMTRGCASRRYAHYSDVDSSASQPRRPRSRTRWRQGFARRRPHD